MILDPPLRTFVCPSCDATHTVRDARPITPMHMCKALKGLMAPFVETHGAQTLARGAVRHRVVERDDYLAGERGIRIDGDGRVVMAISTERADGSNDVHVFAPSAVAKAKEQ